jgi:hypothetical protein
LNSTTNRQGSGNHSVEDDQGIELGAASCSGNELVVFKPLAGAFELGRWCPPERGA